MTCDTDIQILSMHAVVHVYAHKYKVAIESPLILCNPFQDKVEVWTTSDESEGDEIYENENESSGTHLVKPLHYLFVLLLFWQTTYKVSGAGVKCLIRFIKYFFYLLGKMFQCDSLVHASSFIPATIGRIEQLVGLTKGTFIDYVVCPKCSCIYEYNDCVLSVSGRKQLKKCCHVEYPNHPRVSRRKSCGTVLLKSQKKKKGTMLTPIKVFPYRPLKRSISQLLKRSGFIEKCELRRSRAALIPDDFLGIFMTVMCGNIFLVKNLEVFLDSPYSYLLTMNVDWFQPFVRTVYSTGAIYLTI